MSLLTRTTTAASPVALADMKTHLRVTSSADDTLIQAMIDAATAHCEYYCQRDIRANVYRRHVTGFAETDGIDRWLTRDVSFTFQPIADTTLQVLGSVIDTVDSIEHLVSDIWTAVATSVWYQSTRLHRTYLLQKEGQSWPTNSDPIEDNVRIDYTMKVPDDGQLALAEAGIMRHVALMYEERGDCGPEGAAGLAVNLAAASGAEGMYQSLQVPRI